MNQGPRGDCFMNKTEGQKSRDNVPLTQKHNLLYSIQLCWLLILQQEMYERHIFRKIHINNIAKTNLCRYRTFEQSTRKSNP
jgi:hypothetical protein